MASRWSTARFAVIATFLGGCGLVSGLSDLTTDPGLSDAGSSSGASGTSGNSGSSGASGTGSSGTGSSGTGSSGASGTGSSGASGTGSSGASGDGGACVDSGAEICNDGIDNDCNGATDCADTACSPANTCVPPIPPGWTATPFSSHSRTTLCPAAYGTAADVAVILSDANSCQCACQPTPNSCVAGTYALKTGGVTCSGSSVNLPLGLDCGAVSPAQAIDANTYAQVVPPSQPSSCSGTSSFVGQTAGRMCTGPTAYGGGCPSAGSCVPRGSLGGDTPCISHAGAVACPGGYGAQYFAGSQITDNRSCSGCTCTPQPCGGSVRLYAAATCGGASDLRVTINNVCAPYTNLAFTANEFVINETNGCGVAGAPTVNGTATVTNEVTVCCQPSN